MRCIEKIKKMLVGRGLYFDSLGDMADKLGRMSLVPVESDNQTYVVVCDADDDDAPEYRLNIIGKNNTFWIDSVC